ncbi:MAG: T9SS type A sorting domain-containing protein [Bacteroidales bacterium]|jgi:hypothetical protein|nr:T9SS type A sorting domain-containing protein [Bacteroidales bacterium]
MNRKPLFYMLSSILLLVAAILIPLTFTGQTEGCTDPYALNYDPQATINDGSCYYAETFFTPEQYLQLPSTLDETSGLIYWMGGIWTFNDSGGEPRIYKVDTISGDIIQYVTISNGDNVDWEDIAQDEDFIYIGDFGNNAGNRKDLVVYKLAKAGIPSTGNVTLPAEIISFEYADQQSFVPNFNDNEYDCEAMICAGSHLYLFTKNWVSETTRLYQLSTDAGAHSILPIDTLNTEGLVTGAAYSAELDQVVLCGYRNYVPFIFLLFDFQDYSFFSGNKRRIVSSGMFALQTEGICFKNGYRTFLSCEKSSLDQQVFTFSTAEWTDISLISIQEFENMLDVRVQPNPVSEDELRVEVLSPTEDNLRMMLYDSSGRVLIRKKYDAIPGKKGQFFHLQLPDNYSGIYLLYIMSGNLSAREKIIIQ